MDQNKSFATKKEKWPFDLLAFWRKRSVNEEEYKKLTRAAIAVYDGKFGDRYYYTKFKILP